MKVFSFDADNTLKVTEEFTNVVDGESVVTSNQYSIAPEQLAKHLPMFFGEMPLPIVLQAHAIVAGLPQ